jgi:hypothetical protein
MVAAALLVTISGAPCLAFEFGVGAGVSQDTLRWSIAAPGGAPNVLSQLRFEEVQVPTATAYAAQAWNRWRLSASARYGVIIDGEVHDRDFAGNNETGLFSHSRDQVADNSTLGGTLALGYEVYRERGASLQVVAGGLFYQQRFRITDGFQVVPPTGSFPGLDSTYRSRWYGPSLGLRALAPFPSTPLYLLVEGQVMPAVWYEGEGIWNLRADFSQDPSFRHRAMGWGFNTKLGLVYPFKAWALNLTWEHLELRADHGKDTTFFSDGTVASTTLDEVRTRSDLVRLSVNISW